MPRFNTTAQDLKGPRPISERREEDKYNVLHHLTMILWNNFFNDKIYGMFHLLTFNKQAYCGAKCPIHHQVALFRCLRVCVQICAMSLPWTCDVLHIWWTQNEPVQAHKTPDELHIFSQKHMKLSLICNFFIMKMDKNKLFYLRLKTYTNDI